MKTYLLYDLKQKKYKGSGIVSTKMWFGSSSIRNKLNMIYCSPYNKGDITKNIIKSLKNLIVYEYYFYDEGHFHLIRKVSAIVFLLESKYSRKTLCENGFKVDESVT